MNIPSKLIEDAVNEFAKLPGVGKKTALRFVLHLLKRNKEESEKLGQAVITMRNDIRYCRKCYNISEQELCSICSDHSRDTDTICIVQDIRDVMAIENTTQYRGLYHVLGGLISPMDGVGPKDLHIESLAERVREGGVKEVIMALSATMEGDTTVFYISKKIKEFELKISTIARGVAIGDELEYADEITLGRSIVNRTPYELR